MQLKTVVSDLRRRGVVITRHAKEWQVNYAHGAAETMYRTDELVDALRTAFVMAECKRREDATKTNYSAAQLKVIQALKESEMIDAFDVQHILGCTKAVAENIIEGLLAKDILCKQVIDGFLVYCATSKVNKI